MGAHKRPHGASWGLMGTLRGVLLGSGSLSLLSFSRRGSGLSWGGLETPLGRALLASWGGLQTSPPEGARSLGGIQTPPPQKLNLPLRPPGKRYGSNLLPLMSDCTTSHVHHTSDQCGGGSARAHEPRAQLTGTWSQLTGMRSFQNDQLDSVTVFKTAC